MRKYVKSLVTVLTLLLAMVAAPVAVKADEGLSAYITVSDITKTTAKIDWSAFDTYLTNSCSVVGDITYDVSVGAKQVLNGVTATGAYVYGLEAGNLYLIDVAAHFDVDEGTGSCSKTEYEWEEFTTLGTTQKVDLDPIIDNTTSPVVPDTTQKLTLATPKVKSVSIVNGTLNAVASNVDTYKTYKLEWRVYDKKTGKRVKSDVSYNTAITMFGVNGRKVYYVKCRAVGHDADYNDVYSKWSKAKYFVTQPKVTTKSKDVKKDKITIKWKKVTGAKNYTIYAKKGNSKKWTKLKTTSKNSFVFTKFKGKKLNTLKNMYYFTIVSNAKAGGKTIKSGKNEYYYSYLYYR